VGLRAVLDIAVVKRKIPSPHRKSNPSTPITLSRKKVETSGKKNFSYTAAVIMQMGNLQTENSLYTEHLLLS
jgi:hypothetical protein